MSGDLNFDTSLSHGELEEYTLIPSFVEGNCAIFPVYTKYKEQTSITRPSSEAA